MQSTISYTLDYTMGEFTHDGQKISWNSCLQDDDMPFSRCLSRWSSYQAGMPTGKRSLWNIVSQTAKNDLILGGFLFLFVILFPLSRAFFFIVRHVHKGGLPKNCISYLVKWSMIEVLALALMITFTKAHQFLPSAFKKEAGSCRLFLSPYSWRMAPQQKGAQMKGRRILIR